MPATFTAVRGAFTPSTTNDNWTLQANSGFLGVVRSIGWGGRTQQSTAYRTRWAYPSAAPTGAGTTMTVQSTNPAQPATVSCISTYATTQPTLPAEPIGLHSVDWNGQGGEGVLNFPRRMGWVVAFVSGGVNQYLSCRNVVGTDASGSDYWVIWEE